MSYIGKKTLFIVHVTKIGKSINENVRLLSSHEGPQL